MKLYRILNMTHTELIHRSWQETTKSIGHMVTKACDITHKSPCLFEQLKSGSLSADYQTGFRKGNFKIAEQSLQKQLQAAAIKNFFSGGIDDRIPGLFNRHFPGVREQILDEAESISRREFNILGYGKVYFGDPVEWNLDPISRHRVSLIHWSRIKPLNSSAVGDSKVIWELNRHQWLIDLGLAYQFTGEEKYAQLFAACISEWMRANPPGLGINWSSSLEVSIRLISWCWTLVLFRHSKTLTPALFIEMMAWIGSHASYVERYLSRYFSPNTHLTGEALGLYYAGLIFPEFQNANRWHKLGKQILEDQIERQVYADGVYFEQSTRYQHYTAEIYLHFLVLASRNNEQVSPVVMSRVQQMFDFLLAVRQPDGAMPQVGDADGGCLLPFVQRSPDDFRGLFSTAAVFFKRQDYAWAAQTLAAETVWLLGYDSQEIFQSLLPAPPETPPSRMYPHGGYTLMRNNWNDDACQLIFDTGQLGCPYSSGHGHADLLSIQCSAFGQSYLVDAGTYCYTANKQWRDYFRSTFAHNTVTVDGMGQSTPAGPFSWDKKPYATLRRWIINDETILADAEHDAYHDLSDPVNHRRRVLFVRSQYWIIVDDLAGRAEHLLESAYQFPPFPVSLNHQGWVEAAGRNGQGLRIKAFSSVELKVNIISGQINPIRGWISPDYGKKIPAPQLVYSVHEELPVRIVTLLLPTRDLSNPPPVVVQEMDGREMLLTVNGGQVTIVVNDHDITVSKK